MQKVLNSTEDDRLRAYVVWQPILGPDDRAKATQRSLEFTDSRMSYFWDTDLLAGKAWQELLGIGGAAWDVYFLYGPEARWESGPPLPDFWMHQLGSARGKAPFLNGDTFKTEVHEALTESQ